MKRAKFSIGISAFILEIMVFICFFKLTDKNSYFWIGVGLFTFLAVLTIYFIIVELTKLINNTYTEKTKQESDNKKEFTVFLNDCIKSFESNNEAINLKMEELSEIQKNIINDNALFCNELNNTIGKIAKENGEKIDKITIAVNADRDLIQQKLTEISQIQMQFIKDNDKYTGELHSSVDALSSTVQNYIEKTDSLLSKTSELSEQSEIKISHLTERMISYNDDIKEFRENVVDVCNIIKSTIKKGITDYEATNKTFNSTLNRTIENKLDEYNCNCDKLIKKIDALIDVCNSNTNSYQESLDFISKLQNESNNLAKEDIQLLQQLMKR